jgi:hypothetical protein
MATPAIDPQIVSFTNPRRSFVLHNAKRKRVEVMYAGNMMTLPAVDEVHARKAAKDADGTSIPGTYVVEDDYVFVPEFGDEVLLFDAAKAVAHILGLRRGPDGKFTEASSPFAVGGISLLPRTPTKEQWAAVAADGEKRAWLTEVKNAQQLIQDVDEKNAKRKAAGMEAVHGGRDWDRARALISEYNTLLQQDARKEISLSPVAADSLDDEVELAAIVRAKAIELSQSAGSGLDLEKQKQLFNELLDNPKIRQWAQKEMSFRRRGHLPIKDKDLEAAAALNAGIAETGLEEKE